MIYFIPLTKFIIFFISSKINLLEIIDLFLLLLSIYYMLFIIGIDAILKFINELKNIKYRLL